MRSTSLTASAHAFLVLSCYFLTQAESRRQQILTEDLYAFPKYRVTYLNALPVHNQTAERWLKSGLQGGEHEFLEQPWEESDTMSQSTLKEIGGADDLEVRQFQSTIIN